MNYLQLLRSLFKSLTSGKYELQFEILYRDFMPLPWGAPSMAYSTCTTDHSELPTRI
jgi:hypothetical protein